MRNDCWSVFSIKNAVSPSSAIACLSTDAKIASELSLFLVFSRRLISLYRVFRSLQYIECRIFNCHPYSPNLLIIIQRPDELTGVCRLAVEGHRPGAVGRHVVSKRHRVGHCEDNPNSLAGSVVSDYLKYVRL